jgi:outer membrane protein
MSFYLALAGALFLSGTASSLQPRPIMPLRLAQNISQQEKKQLLIEAKVAAFIPTDQTFKKIYGSTGGIYGLEATFSLHACLSAWASADYFSQQGHSIGGDDPTQVTLVPLGLGLKYFFRVKRVDFYLGAGLLGAYLHLHDHSPYVIQHLSKWGIGGVAKIGALYHLKEHLFVDVFTSYSHLNIDFHHTHHGEVICKAADLSHVSIGAGIGYCF